MRGLPCVALGCCLFVVWSPCVALARRLFVLCSACVALARRLFVLCSPVPSPRWSRWACKVVYILQFCSRILAHVCACVCGVSLLAFFVRSFCATFLAFVFHFLGSFPAGCRCPFSAACCAFSLFRAKRARTHRSPGPFAGASPAAGWSFLLRVLRPLRVRLPFLSFFPDRPAHLRVLRPPRSGHSSCGCFARCAFGCDRSPGPFAGASPAARTFTLALHCFINIHF